MESVKRRKLKFPCFSGDNEESLKCRTVQSWPPCIATTEQSLFKFEVGKGTSKQRNVKSARKCSPSILAMLMGRGRHFAAQSIHKQQKRLSDSSSKNVARHAGQKNDNLFHHKVVYEYSEASHVANQHHSSQSVGTHDKYKKSTTEVGFHRCKYIDDRGTVKTSDTRMKEGFESGCVNLVEFGYLGDESLHVSTSISASESEVITTPSRITIHQNDRLTHLHFNTSEPSLIREAKNRMLERWKMTNCVQEDLGMVSKGRTLGEMFSSTDKETRPAESESVEGLVGVNNVFDSLLGSRSTSMISSIHDPTPRMNVHHEDDADEKVVVYSEPLNRDRRKDLPYEKVRYNKRHHSSHCSNITGTEFGNYLPESHSGQKSTETSFENESSPKHESLVSFFDGTICEASLSDAVAGYEIEMSPEISNRLNQNLASRMLRDVTSSWADENTSKTFQLSGPESEYSKSLKNVDHNDKCPVLEVPPSDEDVSSDSDCFERLNSRLQDLKEQLHLLKVESTLTSNKLTPTRKMKPLDQLSSVAISDLDSRDSFMAQILQASEIYDIAPDTFSPLWETTHHPIDPRVFYHLEKYYFEGEDVLRSEKRLLYDYFEQTYIRTSKSMVAYPWVRPEKRESQLTLTKLNLKDQIRKVVYEMELEEEESFCAINYDKDPEWLQSTNEVDNLGKLLAELVLNDLLLEVVDS